MARKKEYGGMTADSSSTTSSGGKRISKNNMSNDAQCKMDLNRLNPTSKRKEVYLTVSETKSYWHYDTIYSNFSGF